jgi:hypothetical protein
MDNTSPCVLRCLWYQAGGQGDISMSRGGDSIGFLPRQSNAQPQARAGEQEFVRCPGCGISPVDLG